jgi:hypothetical protein
MDGVGDTYERILTGEAEVLRATYFGELVLAPEKFRRMHDEAMAPIRKRWEPLLHVEVDVERNLKAALGTPGTWPVFRQSGERLAQRATMIDSETAELRDDERQLAALSPPENFDRDGNVLYLREDLLLRYADARDLELVWAVWGERNLTNLGYRQPKWCYEIYQRHGHLWRRITTLRELASST